MGLLGQLLLAALGLACIFLTLVVLYLRRVHHKYSHIPGPPRNSFFFGNAADLKKNFDRGQCFAQLLLEWLDVYGQTFCVFFFHRPIIFTIDPEAVKEILIGNHRKPKYAYQDIAHIYGQRLMGGGLVTETDHSIWKERRNLLNPAFHRTVLKGLMKEFNETADDLVKKLQGMAERKETICLRDEMHRTTLDVIGKVAFAKDINSLYDDKSPFPSAIKTIMKGISRCLQTPSTRYFPFNLKYKKEVQDACKLLRNTGKDWIAEREESMAKGESHTEDILTYIIDTKGKVKVDPLEKVLDDFITFLIAGQETTANTLAFVLMEIGRAPDIFKKLQEEIDSVIGQKPIIDFDDLGNLEYASMAIKETLRMYPPGTLTFRETSKDLDMQGYFIPKGTSVMVSPYVSGRAADLHSDPLMFNPERFKHDSPDRPTMYTYFPFSLGTRSCIGQTFAQIEAKVILAKFIQHFEMNLDPNQSFDIQEAVTLTPKGGTMATLTLRSQQ